MKVLIIEDDSVIVESLEILFELRSTEDIITSVAEGKKGVEFARTSLPDVIILDLGMPDIDGFEVLRQIRNFSDVPIIILTAWHGEKYKAKGLELGADDFITKPFYPFDLLARVEAVLYRNDIPRELKSNDDLPPTAIALIIP